MKEIYKEYPYDKRYKVSNLGNVKGVKGFVLKYEKSNSGYYRIKILKKNITIHQMVAQTFLGYERDGTNNTVVDHINGNKLDNRLSNLRIISNRDNLQKRGGTSKYVGVHKQRNSWLSNVTLNNVLYYLGSYKTEEEAHIAYIDALNEYNKFLAE